MEVIFGCWDKIGKWMKKHCGYEKGTKLSFNVWQQIISLDKVDRSVVFERLNCQTLTSR